MADWRQRDAAQWGLKRAEKERETAALRVREGAVAPIQRVGRGTVARRLAEVLRQGVALVAP